MANWVVSSSGFRASRSESGHLRRENVSNVVFVAEEETVIVFRIFHVHYKMIIWISVFTRIQTTVQIKFHGLITIDCLTGHHRESGENDRSKISVISSLRFQVGSVLVLGVDQ